MALGLGGDRLRHGVDALLDEIELDLAGDQRHHDFRRDRLAGRAAGLDRGLENGARLHLRDFRIGDGQPAAAEAEHRIELVQFAGAIARAFADRRPSPARLRRSLLGLRQEFVQRRIEQPDGDRQRRP